jgi:hypothetical protein
MKKLLLSIIVLFTFSTIHAQDSTAKQSKVSFYMGPIFAFTDGDELKNTLTPMLASGICWKYIALELDLGRTNINFSTKATYFWEVRYAKCNYSRTFKSIFCFRYRKLFW